MSTRTYCDWCEELVVSGSGRRIILTTTPSLISELTPLDLCGGCMIRFKNYLDAQAEVKS